jgi:hypothetical protein
LITFGFLLDEEAELFLPDLLFRLAEDGMELEMS